VSVLSAGLVLFSAGVHVATAAESKDPIKIVINNWSSQLVLANVVGQILESQGYNVEYVPSDSQLQFTAIANGDMHYQVEVWEGSMAENFEKAEMTGGLVDAGTHNAVTREDWWYPSYMNERCPGLPDWKALNKCAEMFSVAETAPKGRFVGPPADWGKHFSERIAALGMDFEEIPVGQAATLWSELQAAYDRKEPVVLFNWTPNYIEAKFDGQFVDFPEYAKACHEDKSWGMNPNALYDCGAAKKGWLKKAIWKGVKDKWPKAWKILHNVDFNNAQIAAAASYVDVEGLNEKEAAQEWVKSNKSVWSKWVN
jgi:glycine betaine/proline transport system substrate-binding protein